MAIPLPQTKIVRVHLMNDEFILVEFSNGPSALIPTERMMELISQIKDSITWSNGGI